MDDKTSVKPHVSPILATPPIQRLGQFATLFRVYQIQKKKINNPPTNCLQKRDRADIEMLFCWQTGMENLIASPHISPYEISYTIMNQTELDCQAYLK